MSGHSKWSTIKRKKGVIDAKKGKVFTKIIREITVAARTGGGDPSANPRLRMAIDSAKSNSMPKDNIERAIKKGTGELASESYEETTYEGYGPVGIAVLVETVSDNKNRTTSEIRNLFTKNNGNLGEMGCVSWMFEKKGVIALPKASHSEDKLMDVVFKVGADDLQDKGDEWEITTSSKNFISVKDQLDKMAISYTHAELTMVPKNTIIIKGGDAERVIKFVQLLEDHDDVQHVYANFDIPDEEMESIVNE